MFRKNVTKQSNADKLIDLTTIRVIIIVFLFEIISIFLDKSLYSHPKTSMQYGLQLFNDYKNFSKELEIDFNFYVKFYQVYSI